MGQLQTYVDQIERLGFQLVGIAPDPSDKLTTMAERAKVTFRLLSDEDFKAAKAFGVAFQSEGKRALPVPSVFIIAPNARIQYVHINPDYSERLHPDVLLAMLRDVADRFEIQRR